MPMSVEEMEKEILAIKARNKRVEGDKAWEVSSFRVASIAILTYLVVVITLLVIGVENAVAGALIPALGFILSTRTLPQLKQHWLEKKYKNEAWVKAKKKS